MVSVRGRAAVMCVSMMLAGCSTPSAKEATAVTPATQVPPPAAATRQVDLLRLGEIEDAFPAGYVPHPRVGPRTLDAQSSESVGDFVSYGRELTVTPTSCRALLRPVEATAGTEGVDVASSTRPEDPFIAVSADDPVSVPAGIPETGCDHFTFVVAGGGVPDGKVERLAAPRLDDAVTYAVKVVFLVPNSSVDVPLVEYFYTAILDGRTFVDVWARVPAGFAPEPALPDLLTKAVAALRGR